MVRICDAIMGSGKTQSTIAYMNEHPDEKYIYITPYLDEAARIKNGCKKLNFIEPNNKIAEFGFSKVNHTEELIKEGRNIATTHQAFKSYSQEMLDLIKEQGYILFIDENVDVLEPCTLSAGDIQLLIDAGYISKDGSTYSLAKDDYKGVLCKEIFSLLRTRDLIRIESGGSDNFFYWLLPYDLFSSFKDVFVLTYLFSGQSLHHFMEIYNIEYEYIGISKTGDMSYRFSEYPGYVPDYTRIIKDKMHIIDNSKLNSIGDDRFALSVNWFKKNPDNIKQLKNNVTNVFKNILDFAPAEQKMWSSFKDYQSKLKGNGYSNGFLAFNTKATNNYRNKTCLAYLTNIFMNPNEKIFYEEGGVSVSDDDYALSVMVQWIWRSAIRDGEEIYIYVPSSRMRGLLTDWMDKVSKGGSYVE